jgi:hypothetical protein
VVSYLAFSIPAVIAGFATSSFGLRDTATGYGTAIIVLALVVVAHSTLRRRAVPATAIR